jgi:hypothetical protein
MVKVIGNAPDPQNFYSRMVKKNFKNQWRESFSKGIIKLAEKAKQDSKRLLVINDPVIEVAPENKVELVKVGSSSSLVNKTKLIRYRTGSLASISSPEVPSILNTTSETLTIKSTFFHRSIAQSEVGFPLFNGCKDTDFFRRMDSTEIANPS